MTSVVRPCSEDEVERGEGVLSANAEIVCSRFPDLAPRLTEIYAAPREEHYQRLGEFFRELMAVDQIELALTVSTLATTDRRYGKASEPVVQRFHRILNRLEATVERLDLFVSHLENSSNSNGGSCPRDDRESIR